jgi:hypothetical protein
VKWREKNTYFYTGNESAVRINDILFVIISTRSLDAVIDLLFTLVNNKNTCEKRWSFFSNFTAKQIKNNRRNFGVRQRKN